MSLKKVGGTSPMVQPEYLIWGATTSNNTEESYDVGGGSYVHTFSKSLTVDVSEMSHLKVVFEMMDDDGMTYRNWNRVLINGTQVYEVQERMSTGEYITYTAHPQVNDMDGTVEIEIQTEGEDNDNGPIYLRTFEASQHKTY